MILSAVCFCVFCAHITVFSFGRYYLESMHVDEGGSPSPYFHRLDDIADPVVTGRPLSDREKVESLRTRVVADTRQRVDMFGSGTAKKLFLEVSGTHAKYVYERFGHDLKFCHIDENDDRNVIGYACVSVMPSPTFYRWLFGMDGAVRLAKPKGKRWVENDAYLGPLVSRYPIGEMPAWVFLELSSFGAFADFYLFCADRWGDSGMRDNTTCSGARTRCETPQRIRAPSRTGLAPRWAHRS